MAFATGNRRREGCERFCLVIFKHYKGATCYSGSCKPTRAGDPQRATSSRRQEGRRDLTTSSVDQHSQATFWLRVRRSPSLRGSANRRVAYVSRNNGKAVESLLELPSMKSCQPIGGSSKLVSRRAGVLASLTS